MTPRRTAVAAAFAFLAAVYLFSTYRDFGRGPHVDEVEHLHTAVRMARGERIFIDFSQHHPPLFYTLLMPFVPKSDALEAMQRYVLHARLVVALLSAMAIACAALIVWRTAGNAWTVVIFVALVFAAGGVWRNGLGDIRPDAAGIALWWAGAAVALLAERAALRGVGIGLIFVAGLVIPKWPLMSAVIAIALLVDIGRAWRSLLIAAATAIATAAAGMMATAFMSDLGRTFFNVFELTRRMQPLAALPEGHPPFFACPLLLRPKIVLLAVVLIALAWARARRTFASPRLIPVLLAAVLASVCEIRFVYRYPLVDHRMYANWVLAASALLALAPQSAAAVLTATSDRLRKLAAAVAVAGVALPLVASIDIIAPPRPQPDSYWRWSAWMLARMDPGDTVWLDRPIHPLGAKDATYYWLGMGDAIPASREAQGTEAGRRFLPPFTEADLPPCRVERGLDHTLRFLSQPFASLRGTRACFDRLVQRGVVVRTPVPNVWMVARS